MSEDKREVKITSANNPDGVVFSASRKTLKEAYDDLPPAQQEYYDLICEKACSKVGVKDSEALNYYTVLLGRERLVRLRIRRGYVEAVFYVEGNSFKKIVDESSARTSKAPSVIKVKNDDCLEAVFNAIDKRYDELLREKLIRIAAAEKRRRKP